ncbi:MAG TPA: hypothetical protein VIJ86_06230 [Acidimicrobiales bacterium]
MSSPDDVRGIEELLMTWDSLRTVEGNRRSAFVEQRDEALKHWREHGTHTDADEHYIEFRLARGVTTLAEVIELDERSSAAYVSCRGALETLATLSEKERKRALARTRSVAVSAICQDMRYLAALTSSFQSEIDQIVGFMHERESDSPL